MRRRILLAAGFAASVAPAAAQVADAATRAELLPTGALRVGVGVGPVASAFWATRGPDGQPRGVTLMLAEDAARRLGVPLVVQSYNSSVGVTEAGARGAWDLSFMPVDLRAQPWSISGRTTSCLPAPTSCRRDPRSAPSRWSTARASASSASPTPRRCAARRAQPRATFTGAVGVDEVLARMAQGEVDAVALGRESLDSLLPRLPGARILDGHFHATGTAVAVPRGRPLARAWAAAFMEDAKRDGTVRRALAAMAIAGPVAPDGSRTAGA